ncbi:twin-arginine translocation pathway signal [Capsaspora owczarzaki ATCC 30864]|uniref:Twin-arginine translocation pathway signal n=1 Tax=Capsaspora owczarzaki (strain ATCC 30864) TaxID=595528 RepID=A0A0D2VZC0_CAPO3|nr:twin-arginine translocation pathway signal [Capsaspora owczarzaki ATCC 30864]KJE97157.1 twin-arginine translocation pathway signal [Capsaspora owczarzaki ATCC 30864]|eukprot:XP_004343486.2 twin-arginine translocation pathway signal [Capsaspora owczarzaki ATCC 30864]
MQSARSAAISSLVLLVAVLLACASAAAARRPVVCNAPSISAYLAPSQVPPGCPVGPAFGGAVAVGDARPIPADRKFVSPVVDSAIQNVSAKMKDQDLAGIFANSLPNTLDTTVYLFQQSPSLSSFIITGDITAMWLRDSTNQLLPYLRFVQQDSNLRNLVHGAINRQVENILSDVYANAFNLDQVSNHGDHTDDQTSRPSYLGTSVDAMANKLVFERKYELDSLCAVLKLSYAYYNATRTLTPFNANWVSAISLILSTMQIQTQDTAQEDKNGGPAYSFQRTTNEPSDSLLHGRGYPCSFTGMIKSNFRPSDDANIYCFSIPSNAMAVVELRHVAEILSALGQSALASQASALATSVDAAIRAYGVVQHPVAGQIFAYEVDGFGNYLFMDDANIPSLLSLPYLGYINASDALYQRTRAAVLSSTNPWYFSGAATDGVGGPHNGVGWIWPMAISIRAFTSVSDTEISKCLEDLKQSSAGSGFMHESFWRDSYGSYTRPWFAWANSLFGDLILHISDTRPYLIY